MQLLKLVGQGKHFRDNPELEGTVPLGHFAKQMQVYLAISNDDIDEGNLISTFGVKIGYYGFAKYGMLELEFGNS